MSKTFILSAVILFLNVLATTGQEVSYANSKLKETGDLLSVECRSDFGVNIPDCLTVIKGKEIVVEYDSSQIISHLGISLFAKETKKAVNTVVCNFIERILLELVLQATPEDMFRKMEEYKIAISKNGQIYNISRIKSLPSVLEKIRHDTPFAIQKEQKTYTAVWDFNDGDILSITFPSDRELVSGENKKEADEMLNKALSEYQCRQNISLDTIYSSYGLTFIPETNIYKKEGLYYITDSINENVYYAKQSDSLFCIVDDDSNVLASVSNLFQGHISGSNVMLEVKHHGYGNLQPEIRISLKDFVCLFRNDFNLYCAVRDKETDEMSITLVLYNKYLDYIHLLSVTTTKTQVLQRKDILKADFYSNIPQYHI
ncbi:MAG: hypothetical protein LBD80_06790 [Tannerella sp.]|jgi:hypothetical protein|nr:hypothetical protein [Tannerella sp.]